MNSLSKVPSSSTLQSLGLKPGDAVFVDEIAGGMVTLSVTRKPLSRSSGLPARDFVKKWAGKFKTPETDGDSRLAHLLEKHVK